MATLIRIIGVDPGSRITGYGVLDSDGFRHKYIASGIIKIEADSLGDKLGIIYRGISDIVSDWQPVSMAIEQVFVNRNVDSALKLGQARGAAICAGVQAKLPVGEYSPRAIKKAVTGTGGADKQQIQQMVQRILQLHASPQSDEADALAVAICHAHHFNVRTGNVAAGSRRGRWL